jgi:hypothetical protein
MGEREMDGVRNRAKTLRRLAQAAAVVVAIGITISFGARSFASTFASTVELADRPISSDVPESAKLFGAGVVLVAVAASARRVAGRRTHAH